MGFSFGSRLALVLILALQGVLGYPPEVPPQYRIEVPAGMKRTTHIPCQEQLLWWYSRNKNRAECRPQFDPNPAYRDRQQDQNPDISRVIKSWDVDYLFPSREQWKAEKILATRFAVHKCKVMQDFHGCPQELIQRELAQDYLFECPLPIGSDHFTWVLIIGFHPNNVGECDGRYKNENITKSFEDSKYHTYWAIQLRKTKKVEKEATKEVTQIASKPVEVPDMICFEVDGSAVGASGSGHWFEPSSDP